MRLNKRANPIGMGAPAALFAALAVLALGLALVATPVHAARKALVIGNDDYHHGNLPDLTRAIRGALRRAGFEVTLREDRNRRDMLKDFRDFIRTVTHNDEVVVFYSGHGVRLDGKNYLAPTDARGDSRENARDDSISLARQLDALRRRGPSVSLVIIDACRNDPFASVGRAPKLPGLAGMSGLRGQLVIYAAGEGQIALDRLGDEDPDPNSVFTRVLLDEMARQSVPIQTLALNVRRKVHALAQSIGHEQWPALYDETIPDTDLQLATIEVEPGGGGVDFGDLERLRREREAVRASLSAWQARMEADFARAEAFSDAKLSVEAWSRFLSGYKEDNPYSGEDERLRREAVARRARAQARLAGAGNESLGGAMVRIEPGCFQMGSPPSEDGRYDNERRHRVCIERAFAIGKHEVTVGQFRRFVTDTGYRSDAERDAGGNSGCYAYQGGSDFGWTEGSSWREPGFSQGEDHPVLCVSWNDAMAYVAWLNGRAGGGYRLPTEAEWEYAARGGSQSAYTFGPDAGGLCRYANVADRALKQRIPTWKWSIASCDDGHVFTAPVGAFKANPWGLHDVHGNVWEWTCSDYDKDYSGGEQGCADAAAHYATRGGSWNLIPRSARSADRGWVTPVNRGINRGFRLARTLP